MFPSSRRPTWLAWAATVVFLLTNLSPGSGLVLCVGQDGHVAIEVASSEADCSDCAPEQALVDDCCTAPGQSPEQEPLGCACSDIPLVAGAPDAGSIAPTKKGPAKAQQAGLIARSEAGFLPARGLDVRGRGQAPPRFRASVLTSLRI